MKYNTFDGDEIMNFTKHILSINGGSSSIKFALFAADSSLQRILRGEIERIGLPGATFRVKGSIPEDTFSRAIEVPNTAAAVGCFDRLDRKIL